MISLSLGAAGAVWGPRHLGLLLGVDQAEGEGETEEKRKVAEEDQAVGPEDCGEHVDVERDWSVWDYPHQTQVQL